MTASAAAEIVDFAAFRASRAVPSLSELASMPALHVDRSAVRVGNIPVHRTDRIRPHTQGATKAWRALAAKLAGAYDALAAEGEAALPAWRGTAAEILHHRDATTDDFSALVNLAALMAGVRAPVHIHTDDWSPDSPNAINAVEAAMLALHMRAVFPRRRDGRSWD